MSDDLVKCLSKGVADVEQQQGAADRIRKLDRECVQWDKLFQRTYQRVKKAEAYAAELEAKLEKAVEGLREIARQKKTDEFETKYDVEVADFEDGYDLCIDRARATLAELKGETNE
jgi:hypothetical protein